MKLREQTKALCGALVTFLATGATVYFNGGDLMTLQSAGNALVAAVLGWAAVYFPSNGESA